MHAQTGPSLVLSDQPGWNGWSVSATVRSGYRERGGPGEDSATNTGNLNISPFGRSVGEVVTMTPVETLFVPDSGVPAKDKSRGKVEFAYEVGAGATSDGFRIDWNTATSAANARHDFGAGPVPADSFVEIELVLTTFAPVTGGDLRLPGLPTLTAPAPSTESLLATVSGPLDGFFMPGGAGMVYPLTLPSVPPATPGRTQFTYTLTYSILTPFGTDPEVAYTLRGGVAGPASAPPPAPTAEVEAVRREMPVVRLDKLVYDGGDFCTATVHFVNPADIRPHNTLVLISPDEGDYELVTLTGIPLATAAQASSPMELQDSGVATPNDGKLKVAPGGKFLALYSYNLPGRIGQGDAGQGILPGNPYYSLDFGLMYQPNVPGVSATITPGLALQPDEESRPPGHRRLGTLAVEGRPGIVQIASEDLVLFPGSTTRVGVAAAQRLADFLDKADASVLRDDSYMEGNNEAPQWLLCRLLDTPEARAIRADRIRYLPQLLAVCGVTGNYHASNGRTLEIFATGMELWLEGYNCAVNPRLEFSPDLSAPEGVFTDHLAVGNTFSDSMLSLDLFLNDPLQQQRDMFSATAMQDHDAVTVRAAFLDLGFAPNPDFRGYPDRIPQANISTGLFGPHVAEEPGTFRSESGAAKWHGNGTVAVAGGVFGNRYGFTGPGGQVMQPMLFKMNEAEFVFEAGVAIDAAVGAGADVINISAGFPCRILTVLGPTRICSEADRADLLAAVQGLVIAANGIICGVGPVLDAFLPGLGVLACSLSTTATAASLTAFFDALYVNTLLDDPRTPMERGVASATANGVPVVASAGNNFPFEETLGELAGLLDTGNRSTADWEIIPASIPEVLSIGAAWVAPNYPNVQFHGPGVDLWGPTDQPWLAPDVSVDDPDSVTPADHMVYNNSGTSFSAPFVTGVICQMMAANPSLHRARATAPQESTLVSRLTAMLASSATLPGSRPELPVSSESNPEVALRGPLVHAFNAREAARADAGLPALGDGGFNPRFARFDDETGPRPDSSFINEIEDISGPVVLGLGGLCHGDRDRYRVSFSSSVGTYPSALLRLSVPTSTIPSPPPVLFNGSSPLRPTGTGPGVVRYDFVLEGCQSREIDLSTISATSRFPSSPIGVNDVLYRLEVVGVTPSVAVAGPDRFEGSGSANNSLATPTAFAGSLWTLIDPPYSITCASGSRAMTITDVGLHGCGDIDHYRLPRWSGYAVTDSEWAELEITLDPPADGVCLRLFKPMPDFTYTELTTIGNGRSGLRVNADSNPLQLVLAVDGSAAHRFDIRIRHCIAGSLLRDLAGTAGSARDSSSVPGFFEQLRELRMMDLSVPRTVGFPELIDLVKFNWERDEGGRSMRGQVFRLYHGGGRMRFLATPLVPEASLRLDFFNMNGVNIGGIATADIEAVDGKPPGLEYRPQSLPMELDLGQQPAGDYLLGMSAFKLTDSWDFLPGASLVQSGYPNLESPFDQLLIPHQPEPPENPMQRLLSGFNQRLGQSLTRGLSGQAQPTFNGNVRIEYSLDGEFWFEGGGLFGFSPYFSLVPPPGAQVRFAAPWAEEILPFSSTSPLELAIPTEAGASFHIESSDDLEHWMREPDESFLGDGSIFHWPIFMDGPRGFFRAVQDW